jgi:iron complex outermembrane receptor protein
LREHFIIIAFLFSYVGFGQQPTQPQDSITPLDEVIISDVPLKKQALPLVTSDLIGQDIIQQYSPVDLISTLNQSPGILVFSGAVNTNRITIRGIGARTPYGTNKLRMYYNNIPITNGSGFSELEAFDLENLYGLEIIKGPKSTLYGANLGGGYAFESQRGTDQFHWVF